MSQVECPACQASFAAGTKFCTSCGFKIPAAPPPQPAPAPNPQVQLGIAGGYSAPPRLQGMVEYDPVVIQSFADGLYRAADRIVMISALLGALFGGAVGFGLGAIGGSGSGMMVALIGLAVGGFIGHSRGMSKTFQLRLEAQLALCQVEIEFNTRSLRQ